MGTLVEFLELVSLDREHGVIHVRKVGFLEHLLRGLIAHR